VAVIGGGNSAIEAALDMVKIAEHVDMISVTPLTGDAIMIEKLNEAKNLTFTPNFRRKKCWAQAWWTDSGEEPETGESASWMIPECSSSRAGAESDMVKDLLKLNKDGEVPVNCSKRDGNTRAFLLPGT